MMMMVMMKIIMRHCHLDHNQDVDNDNGDGMVFVKLALKNLTIIVLNSLWS